MQPAYYSNVRLDVLDLVPKKEYRRVMEVGGGEFSTLLAFNQDRSIERWGVDVYPCSNSSLTFIHGSIESASVQKKIPNRYFDLILANDVLEHLVDSDNFFNVCHQKLAANGCLILSVPNIRQLRALYQIFIRGTFPRNDAGLFDRTHLRWFCKRDVLSIAAGNDFRLIDFRSVGKLVPKVISRSLLAEFLALQHVFVFQKSGAD